MLRFSLVLIIGNIIALILAIFVNIGMGLLIIALFHVLLSSIVIKPRIGELVLGISIAQRTKENFIRIGSSLHYRLYWLVMNLVYCGASVFLLLHDFKFIDLFKW
jgi:hypothetical protein